jgi:hypothetical protein
MHVPMCVDADGRQVKKLTSSYDGVDTVYYECDTDGCNGVAGTVQVRAHNNTHDCADAPHSRRDGITAYCARRRVNPKCA